MKAFDNYEIHGCRIHAVPGETGVETFAEQCPDSEAEYWTLFGHIPGQGLETIRDFPTRQSAEEMFRRITGIPFGSHEEVQARLRVMHAGPGLLRALGTLLTAMGGLPITILNGPMYDALNEVRLAALAAGRKV